MSDYKKVVVEGGEDVQVGDRIYKTETHNQTTIREQHVDNSSHTHIESQTVIKRDDTVIQETFDRAKRAHETHASKIDSPRCSSKQLDDIKRIATTLPKPLPSVLTLVGEWNKEESLAALSVLVKMCYPDFLPVRLSEGILPAIGENITSAGIEAFNDFGEFRFFGSPEYLKNKKLVFLFDDSNRPPDNYLGKDSCHASLEELYRRMKMLKGFGPLAFLNAEYSAESEWYTKIDAESQRDGESNGDYVNRLAKIHRTICNRAFHNRLPLIEDALSNIPSSWKDGKTYEPLRLQLESKKGTYKKVNTADNTGAQLFFILMATVFGGAMIFSAFGFTKGLLLVAIGLPVIITLWKAFNKENPDKHLNEILAKTNKVIAGKTDDDSKIKAIYDWITANVAFREIADASTNETIEGMSPTRVYKDKKGICTGYAQLFFLMLNFAKVQDVHFEAAEVYGTKKILGWNRKASHSWVRIKNLHYDSACDAGKIFGRDKYYALPRDLIEARNAIYYSERESAETREEQYRKRLSKLSEKYKGQGFALLGAFE